jgi:hypothetical protein
MLTPDAGPRDGTSSLHVRACRLVRKMQGGSQADLVLTDRGYYVVKWVQNPQHRRVLVNEMISAELLRRLRIAAPEWAVVHADDEFLDANPEVRINLRHGHASIKAGCHFGSRVPVDPIEKAIYDFLPPRLHDRVTNLNDFLRVLIFDLWVDNSDGRQAIFFATPKGHFAAQMIDNGHTLGFDGTDWRMKDQPVGKCYPLSIERFLTRKAGDEFESVITDILAVVEKDLSNILHLVRAEWLADDEVALGRVFVDLARRSRRLPDLVADALKYLRTQNVPRTHLIVSDWEG